MTLRPLIFRFFFFNDTATTEIYTLSLHDALPISESSPAGSKSSRRPGVPRALVTAWLGRFHRFRIRLQDRKSTRLNSSHVRISYAVFCLKKKTQTVLTNGHCKSDVRETVTLRDRS